MQAASVRPTGLSRPTALSAPPTRRGATTRALPVAPPNSGPPPAWPRHVPLPPADVKKDGPKKLSLLGSTGSIGTQTLDIVAEHPEEFEVVSLSAGSNAALLADQICSFRPSLVSVRDGAAAAALRAELEQRSELERRAWPEIQHGEAGICAVAAHPLADACVTGIVGCAGLKPTMAAIAAGKDICLANKETLIAGAPAVLPAAAAAGVKILPADSEHSALFQCLQGVPEGGLRRLLLTASGGAFRDWSAEDLKRAGVQDALKHPNWAMGKKITIDSATLMNKGLEVIEAHYLFGVSYDDIEIVIHPQSIIHSLVELADSSVLAQFGWPDMRLPILYTMSWPRRVGVRDATWPRLDLVKAGNLTFATPDHAKYPSMALAYAAGRAGGTMTGVMSAANERAVELFLEEKIGYLDLMHVVEAVCEDHVADLKTKPHLDDILAADAWARARASERAASLGKTVAV